MNKFETNPTYAGEDPGPGSYKDVPSSIHYRPSIAKLDERLKELEVENLRLHRLVAELLIKNQQLRKPD